MYCYTYHSTWLAFTPALGEGGGGTTTEHCPSPQHAHCFSREMKTLLLLPPVCPLLARHSKFTVFFLYFHCIPCSVFWEPIPAIAARTPQCGCKSCAPRPLSLISIKWKWSHQKAKGNQNSILAREGVKQRTEVSALALARLPSNASTPRSLAPLHIFPAFVKAAGPFVCV